MPQNPKLLQELDRMLAKALITDEDVLADVLSDQQDTVAAPEGAEQMSGANIGPEGEMAHPAQTTAPGLIAHIREMINEGYTDSQILELHQEIKKVED